MQLSNATPIVHKHWLGPCTCIDKCEMCGVPCNTTVMDEHMRLTNEWLCWFCFAVKYGQTGNAVKGIYSGVPIVRQFGW